MCEGKMGYTKAALGQWNKKTVINIIRTQGPINKAEIARQAELSIPTVMKITDEFERRHLIRNVGKGESTGGKRPDMFEFVPDAYYIVGADIGRHYVKMVIMDMTADILLSRKFPTLNSDLEDAEGFFSKVADNVEAMIQQSGIASDKIMGIGIGMPGILDYTSGKIIFSPDFDWENVELKSFFQKRFPYNIIVENTNKALAMGEYTYGAAKKGRELFCVNMGHGIGAAIIQDGKILYGKNGISGEFGHIIMEVDGPQCDCGQKGCLEAISSGNAIAKAMRNRVQAEKYNGGSGFVKNLEAKNVFDAAREGDSTAKEVIEHAIKYLGIAIAGVMNLLDPDMIVLAGGMVQAKDVFQKYFLQTVEAYKMKYAGKDTEITFGVLGEYGTAIGVAAMFMNMFIECGGEYEQ